MLHFAFSKRKETRNFESLIFYDYFTEACRKLIVRPNGRTSNPSTFSASKYLWLAQLVALHILFSLHSQLRHK